MTATMNGYRRSDVLGADGRPYEYQPEQASGSGDVEERLLSELTEGYRSTLPLWALWAQDTIPQFYLMRDIEMMMIHPVVRNALNTYKAGVAGAEFEISADSPEVQLYVEDHVKRYWRHGVPKIQGGYEYGWIGCESLYADDGEGLYWEGFVQFSPRDVFLLTEASKPIGIRVKGIRYQGADPKGNQVDLWMAEDDIPAKGIWYAHNPRYNSYYGQSQLLGAWRPWRRLAWKDAAETVIDGGVFRFAYSGAIVGYPEEDFQQSNIGAPATTLDSQGRPRKYARDSARQIAEMFKSGAGVGLPSNTYPPEMGGKPKWTLEIPKSTLNISGLIEYADYLAKQINIGVGVPPELMDAAESGSGYSGRAIPLETFLAGQQQIAENLLLIFVDQCLRPLVKRRFGPVKFTVNVVPLLETKRKQQAGGEEGAAQPGAPNEGMPPPMPGTHQGNSHHPHVGANPPPGQMGGGGGQRSPYADSTGKHLSMTDEQLNDVVRKILTEKAA